jgi:phosphoribosylformylglycinamidine cyclo-ligase
VCNDFDCAGFAVGIVDEDNILGAHRVKNNDIVVGIASSGFHSNGYSLLRKVFEKDLDQWIDQLLIPTRLYVELALSLHDLEKDLHALAHITGGGVENIPRVLPEGLQFKMQAWSLPDAFKEVQARANMSDSEMLTTLNCGVGLAVIVSPGFQAEVIQKAKNFGFEAFVIGSIQEGHNAKS